MRRRGAMRAARASGRRRAQPAPVPLPLRGFHTDAADAEGMTSHAAELTNWQPRGSYLETTANVTTVDLETGDTQRFPFEFSALSHTIGIRPTEAVANGQTLARTFSGRASVAYISAQAVIAGKGGSPILWDGSAFSTPAFTASPADIADLDGVVAHQDRLFFWDSEGGLDFYYGDVGAVTGTLTRFPLGRLGNITGRILTMRSMTLSAGHGMNDVLVILTTTGGIIAYEGLDPGDANDWRQTARVYVAPPISPEAVVNVGGDLWLVTSSGVVSVAQALSDGQLAQVSRISEPVSDWIKDRASSGAWQAIVSADGKLLILNHVPVTGTPEQVIYSFETGAWHPADYYAAWWYDFAGGTYLIKPDGTVAYLDSEARTSNVTATWHSNWIRVPEDRSVAYVQPTIIAQQPVQMTLWVLSDHDQTSGDLLEAVQTVAMQPDSPADAGGTVALNEIIPVGAVGEAFQIRMELTAPWARLVNMKVGIL